MSDVKEQTRTIDSEEKHREFIRSLKGKYAASGVSVEEFLRDRKEEILQSIKTADLDESIFSLNGFLELILHTVELLNAQRQFETFETVVRENRTSQEPPLSGNSRPRSFRQTLAEIRERVPDEEWERIPKDLSANLDHYVYGLPKK